MCKKCNRKFHACTSCCFNHNWEYHYCHENCWRTSDEYIENKKIFDDFYMTLTNKQEKMLKNFINTIWDGDYEFEVEAWLKKWKEARKYVENA